MDFLLKIKLSQILKCKRELFKFKGSVSFIICIVTYPIADKIKHLPLAPRATQIINSRDSDATLNSHT